MRPGEIREFAAIMSAYAIMLPALEAIDEDDELDPIEMEALAIGKKAQKLIRGQIRKWDWAHFGAPPWFEEVNPPEEIVKQYAKSRYAPSEFLLKAQTLSEKAIIDADSGKINNFACGLAVFSAYIDKGLGFKRYPIVKKQFVFDAFDHLLPAMEEANGVPRIEAQKMIAKSLDIGEKVVEGILDGNV